ncbi:MAG: hypothetical protein PF503_18705 [Desulfobacula sp.]|jgi:hypothetical protein|nr:hypothetical protein [Desulfobacula sp.]
MKVLFLYMSKSSTSIGSTKTNDWLFKDCGKNYDDYQHECYFKMFETLLENGTITDLKVFFESGVNSGQAAFVKGAENYVIPEIRLVDAFIDDDTVIFVRGGFKHWHDFLLKYKGKNWLICYAANTGRDKWPWWDIVFDDINMSNEITDGGRYHFPFVKPVNESCFFPIAQEPKYDICIGASNIHDKKGQWRIIGIMHMFHRLFGYYPSAVMPGALRSSVKTTEMMKSNIFRDEIDTPGNLPRNELGALMNDCKIFLSLGEGGQNDRSVLEAHACGCHVMVYHPGCHTPLLRDDRISTHVLGHQGNTNWANRLFNLLEHYSSAGKVRRSNIYKKRMGYNQVVIPMLTAFFNELKGVKPNLITKENLMNDFQLFKGGRNG